MYKITNVNKIMKELYWSLPVCLTIIFFGCNNPPCAQEITDKLIQNAGGDLYLKSDIEFDFRKIHYRAFRDDGKYSFERTIEDSVGRIHDVLNNDEFYRKINGQRVEVIDTMAVKYARSVNSVIYFALLPYSLNDAAVNKILLDEVEIKGKKYFKIKITFNQEGGGEDFNDIFVYWVNQETYHFDYMAYLYYVDGGGMRFREAYNPRFVEGIRFVDYINYKPKEGIEAPIEDFDKLWLEGKMEELSRIENINIGILITK